MKRGSIMTPAIHRITDTQIVGFSTRTTFLQDAKDTPLLWQQLMPLKQKIQHKKDTNTLSIRIPEVLFSFDRPESHYQKWAAVEVSSLNNVSPQLETATLKGGLFATFTHEGPAATFFQTFEKVLQWLADSEYKLDTDRAQFEVLGEHYRPDDLTATEEIWIPIISQNEQ